MSVYICLCVCCVCVVKVNQEIKVVKFGHPEHSNWYERPQYVDIGNTTWFLNRIFIHIITYLTTIDIDV